MSSTRSSSLGLTTKLPSTLPIRTAPTGVGNGMWEIISAAEAPFIARMSYGLTWSTEIGIATSWVSYRQPLGNSGRIGRSIRRAESVAFSPARPSRLKNEPGIFPAAYIRSSTSTVSGRKSTSRRFPAVAVQRTIVSPARTTTAPEACLASLPVSNEISLPSISTDTRVTASDIYSIPFFLRPSVGGALRFFLLVPNATDASGCARIGGPVGVFGCSLAPRTRARRPADNVPLDAFAKLEWVVSRAQRG